MNDLNNTGKSIGICGALGVAFVILKLTHTIEWSWVWVTAPFWGPVALVFALLLLAVIVKAAAKFLGWLAKNM